MGAVMHYMIETWLNTVRRVKRCHEQKRILTLSRSLMEQCHEQRHMIDTFERVPVKELPAVYEEMCKGNCNHWYTQLCFFAYLDRRYKLSAQEWNDIWELMSMNQQFKDLTHAVR